MSEKHTANLQRLCDQFAKATDEHGVLLYPLFDNIREAMGALMETHAALKGMPDSYEKLQRAYAIVMKTFASEADAATLLQDALSRKPK